MKTLLTVVCICVLLATLGCAYADQLTYSDSVSLSTTNWANSISIPKFDPNLGTLERITFVLTGHVEGAVMYENLETVPSTVTADLSAKVTLMRPDHGQIVVSIPVASFTETIAAFDGTMNFSGESGRKHEDLSADRTETLAISAPSTDLGLFIGADDIVLPMSAVGFSSGNGAGNLLLQFNTLASAQASVTYDYIPVPEPSGVLALLTGVGGLVGLVMRCRRA